MMNDHPAPARRVVVMGDVGWPHLYHVGDEAMTQVAIDRLTADGVVDVTVVAADPEVAARLHGVAAVPRFHFKLGWPRDWHDSHLEKVLAPLAGFQRRTGPAQTVLDAVHDADAVVIAGGGNMTSQYVHQLYERLALVRVARHFGRPVFVTSQTLGATFREVDLPVMTEIIDSAAVFGAREGTSATLARSLAADAGRVFTTGDDALLLPRAPLDDEVDDLPERYLVASFERPPGLDDERARAHADRVGRALEAVSQALDCAVVFVPHAGSLDVETPKDDIVYHAAIAVNVSRPVLLPVLPAGQTLAVTSRALVSLSTRYHPVVFAAAAGVPALGFADTAYTWQRMVGATSQYGLARTVLPGTVLDDPTVLAGLVSSLVDEWPHVTEGVNSAVRAVQQGQSDWWRALGCALRGEPFMFKPMDPPAQVPLGVTEAVLADAAPVLGVDSGREREAHRWTTERLEAVAAERSELELRLGRESRERRTVEQQLGEARELVEHTRSEAAALRREFAEEQRATADLAAEGERLSAEKARWRAAALGYRREVQRYRDRRITRISDALARAFRRPS
ncbi:polysaccharide pyruvyl transferase [Curtobacterium sp. PhB137]|nr:polysaccharide pyruvyl transferase [Curtobacterium sp. PhB137]